MPIPRVILLSTTQGSGSGAERVLDHLLGAQSPMIAMVIAPPGSSTEAAARANGHPLLSWQARRNSSADNLLARFRFSVTEARMAGGNLLHAWHTRGFEWGVSLAHRLSIPLVGTLHDNIASPQDSWIRRQLLRSSAHQMAGLAVVSQAVERMCAEADWRVRTTVIRNGLPDEQNPPLPSAERPSVRIGFLGLNELWKGIDTVVALAETLRDTSVSWQLFGSPPPAVAARVDNLVARFPEKVRFHGRRSTAEIYSLVDIIFHPSLAFDPYPTVLLEAARAGVPAVASSVGGAPEIVADTVAGLLFPPTDLGAARAAIELLVADADLRHRLGAAARARFTADFRVATMAVGYEAFWNNAVQGTDDRTKKGSVGREIETNPSARLFRVAMRRWADDPSA